MASIQHRPIKIAVLDDYQNIAHSHFSKLLSPQFQVDFFPDTLAPFNHPATPEYAKTALIQRLHPYSVISSMRERTPFPAALLGALPSLKLLLTTGTRNASIDFMAAKELGIKVAGTPTHADPSKKVRGPDSTTQHTVALILGIARGLAKDDRKVKEGGWQTGLATGLTGKVFASVGLGRLGVTTATIMYQAFGMRIVAWSSSLTQETADQRAHDAGLPVTRPEDGEKMFKVVRKEELFQSGDVVSVHYVLSPRSKGIVGAEDLALMKKSALLINTSRGPLIDEEALLSTLKQGSIKGAAIDVYEVEPLPASSEWRNIKWGEEGRSEVLLTPHMGYVEQDMMHFWYEAQRDNVERWGVEKELTTQLA